MLALVLLASIVLIGEGYMTASKVIIANIVMFFVVSNCAVYCFLNILLFVLWICKLRGRDFIA